MRRINIFVLLCVFIFAMSGSALAAESTTTAKAFFVESKDLGTKSNDILVELSFKSADLPASKDVLSNDLSAPITSADDVVKLITEKLKVEISKDSIVPLRTFKVTGASLDVIISVDLGGAFSTAKASQFVVVFVSLSSDSSKNKAVQATLVNAEGVKISEDSATIPQKFWAGAKLDKDTSFDMIAALKSEGSTHADKPADITVGESTTVTLDSLSEDVQAKMKDVFTNAGIDTTKILTASNVTTVNSADLKTKSPEVYDTITSSDKLTETLSNDSVVVFKSETVVRFGLISLNKGGYVLQKNTVPAGKTFSDVNKFVFYFIKLSSLVSKSSKSENTAALAATGDAVEAVLMDKDGNKLSGSLKDGDTFYAVPSEELEADSYAMVAGEKASSPSSEDDVKPVTYDTLTDEDSTQESEVEEAFDNSGYTVKDILGVFKATANAPAIVKAKATVGSEFVFFVKVSESGSSEKAESATLSATSDLIGSTLLDEDKETKATTTSVYAKSTSNLTEGTTYAVVLAEEESKTIGSSSSGCDAGLGLGALAALALLAIRKTR